MNVFDQMDYEGKMRFTKTSLFFLVLFAFNADVGLCQESQPETIIRVLGVVPLQEFDIAPFAPTHLMAVVQAWNNSGLPARTGVTVQILNGGVPQVSSNVIAVFPGDEGARRIQKDPQVMSLRNAAAADVVILFTRQVSVPLNGGIAAGAAPIPTSFVPDPTEWNLDLSGQNNIYVALANPTFEPFTTSAHEFGHLFGGGHSLAGSRLYEDCRAKVTPSKGLSVNVFDNLPFVVPFKKGFFATAIASPVGDFPSNTPSNALTPLPVYSSLMSIKELGDVDHNNVRCLMTFALSVANYYMPSPAAPPPPQLFPPINLQLKSRCEGTATRFEQTWSDDPRTTALVTRYETYIALPSNATYQSNGSVIERSSNGLLTGSTAARFKVSACSATACSALSTQFLDLIPQCLSQ